MDYIPKDGWYTDEVGGIINPFEKNIWIWYETKTHTQYLWWKDKSEYEMD